MNMAFQKATRRVAKARIALFGPTGSGKTFTALKIARGLVGPQGRIAVIDSERGSATLYADTVTEFDHLDLPNHNPQTYIDAITAAEQAGYDAIIIDSLSHAWMGKDGALELVDEAARRSRDNKFAGWRDVTPLQNRLVDKLIGAGAHLIVTMRSKMEYVLEDNGKGKQVPKKVGLQPVQRDGVEYEFDFVADVDQEHYLSVSKTRFIGIELDGKPLDGRSIQKPDERLGELIAQWISAGDAKAPPLQSRAAQSSAGTASAAGTAGTAQPARTEAPIKDRVTKARTWCEGQNGSFPKWMKAAFLAVCDLAERTEHNSAMTVLGLMSLIAQRSEKAPRLSALLNNADWRWVVKQLTVEKLGLGWGDVLLELGIEVLGEKAGADLAEMICRHGAHLTAAVAWAVVRDTQRMESDELAGWWRDASKMGFPGVPFEAQPEPQPQQTQAEIPTVAEAMAHVDDDIPW